jgi:hypothetical protein
MFNILLLIIGTLDFLKFLIMIFHRCDQILHSLTIKKDCILYSPEIVLEFYGITGCMLHRITPVSIVQ